MMLLLIGDIRTQNACMCAAHRKRRVTILPTKIGFVIVGTPNGSRFLEFAKEIRNGVRRAQARQDMNMIGDAAHRFGHAAEAAHGSSDVSVQLFTPSWCDDWPALLGAE